MSRLAVRLTPSGGADRIDGCATDDAGRSYLKARVRAAPEDGKANAALEVLLAKALGVAKSKVRVVRGATTRLKAVEIEGVSEAELAAFVATTEKI
ncbi:MAG: DUF167 domain-containing protein [Proteobacteria bacterium]|nr:DUF167 domain-containing protein [Pseudomonadota bacterium]